MNWIVYPKDTGFESGISEGSTNNVPVVEDGRHPERNIIICICWVLNHCSCVARQANSPGDLESVKPVFDALVA